MTCKRKKDMVTKDEYPEKYAWWINELNSLGIKIEDKNREKDLQAIENLIDDTKQAFIYDFIRCQAC